MATGAEPPALEGKGQEKFIFAAGVGTTDSGKTLVQISASQVFLDHFVHNRAEKSVLLLAMLVIAGFERFIVGV
jgi:hypothetical protein